MVYVLDRRGKIDILSGHIKNILDQKFGRLTVVEFVGITNRAARWRCICDCGNEKITYGCSLRTGVTKSCGCYNKDIAKTRGRKTEFGATCTNDVFCFYRNHAKKANRDFEFSKEEFRNLIIQSCVYCGDALTNERKSPRSYGEFKYTGLDRVDSSKGYTKENTVPCCSMCNYMKRHHSTETFLNHIKRIVEYCKL